MESKNNPSPETREKISKTLKINEYPAGRISKESSIGPEERTLTANMTGQVMLTGSNFDLQFNKGTLRKISREEDVIFDKLNCRTGFISSKNSIEYRNESAFAFDGDTEYGLRTLQVPRNRKDDSRIYTDFIFNRETGQCIINIAAEYPPFTEDNIITEAALMEFSLPVSQNGISIIADDTDQVGIMPEDELNMLIPGSSFLIKAGGNSLNFLFVEKYNSKQFATVPGLAVKTKTVRRKKYLLINPAGSYTPAPAECYNGVKEQLCIELKLITD